MSTRSDLSALLTPGAPLDEAYLRAARGAIGQLVKLDNTFGGDNACGLAAQAFRSVRQALARQRLAAPVRRELIAAAAELGEVAGWTLFDAERQHEAMLVNQEALNLARLAGESSMELLVIQNMAMQADHLGRPREALWMVQSTLARRGLSPRLRALFRMREARALSRSGENAAALRAMAHARSLYADGSRDDDPAWAWWVNEDQMAIQDALCHEDAGAHARALDLHHEAVRLLPTGQPRGRYINLVTLLRCAVAARAWSDGTRVAELVAPLASVVASSRTAAALGATLQRLDRDATAPARARAAADEVRDALGSRRR